MNNSIRSSFGFSVGSFLLASLTSVTSAHAVPSDREAWRSDKHGVIIYKDAVDNDTYWFVPKIQFEAKEGKTILRSKVLENGKTEYLVRIIPYFSDDLKDLAAQNISNIRMASQLKPVIAKSIGISLPDFGYTFASASVTNFQYLDSPRLMRFTLDAEDAEVFNMLYQDDAGVHVDFSIAYDGMLTDKFYSIEVSCKDISKTLDYGTNPGTGVSGSVAPGVVLGVDIETAFVKSTQNKSNKIDIVSKGDIPEMAEMLKQVMNLCFEPVDGTWADYEKYMNPTRRTDTDPGRTTPNTGGLPASRRGDAVDGGFLSPRTDLVMSAASLEAFELQSLLFSMDIDKALDIEPSGSDVDPGTDTGGLLPGVVAKAAFRFKKSSTENNNQAVVKQVSLKDSTSVIVIPGTLAANQKSPAEVLVKSLGVKKINVPTKAMESAPLSTGIVVRPDQQLSLNAAFVFKAISGQGDGRVKQYVWDASWGSTAGDLYFRIGNGKWTAVNGRAIIESGVVAGGELQFYIDRSSIYNKIPQKLKEGGWFSNPVFTGSRVFPEFVVQISGRQVQVR